MYIIVYNCIYIYKSIFDIVNRTEPIKGKNGKMMEEQPSNKHPKSVPSHGILKLRCIHDLWVSVGFEKCRFACPIV